jgi:deazaflavin-dependent oxidoreductase (nitroreductase family)
MMCSKEVSVVRSLMVVVIGLAGLVVLAAAWMRWTRIGAGFANDIVNPCLVRRGLSGSSASELATLEHVGRHSGIRRLTPLHAIPTADGVRFAVPLGERSEWARNVLVAGRCRMQYHDMLVELDDPRLLAPPEVPGMGTLTGRITAWLGWRYLLLRRVHERPGGFGAASGPQDGEPGILVDGSRLAGGPSRTERLALHLHRFLDKRLNPLGVWVYRRTQGGVARPWQVDALLLTTLGRRSRRERTVVLRFFPDEDAMVVTATNDGADTAPAWYLNLMAEPRARVEIDGRSIPVRAVELPAQEAAAWWSLIVERSPSYARYRRATSRPFPVLRLVPTEDDQSP